jgi:hypothetical protein
MEMLELMLLIAAIFGAGFASGFAVRANISRRHRSQARQQEDNSFTSRFNPVSDAPLMSPAMTEFPIAAAQNKPHRASASTPNRLVR